MRSSSPDSGPPITDEIGIATMNHAMMRVRYSRGKPGREVEGDAGEEAGLGGAQQQPEAGRSCWARPPSAIAADTRPHVIMMREIHTRAPTRYSTTLLGTSSRQ